MLSHKQPALEERLRSKIREASSCELRSGCTVTSISEDDEWVYTRYLGANGVERCIRSRFLVGADGKTGFTRKQYLEPRGVHMQWAEKCVPCDCPQTAANLIVECGIKRRGLR